MKKPDYDAVVVGGGPAGLTCGLYLGRFGITTLVLEDGGQPPQAAYPGLIENYPGFPEGISGNELITRLQKQAKKAGAEILTQKVERISAQETLFEVAASTTTYLCRSLVIATGAHPAELGVSGEKRLKGKGISYCAACDGPLFKGKKVAVVGGGDRAAEEALFLSSICDKVYLVHRRDRLRAAPVLVERLKRNHKVNLILNTKISEVSGKNMVEAVELEDLVAGEKKKLICQGLFIFVGTLPASGLAKDLLKLDKARYILTDELMETSTKGVFACGDVRRRPLRQIVTAAGEGATAAQSCREYLK